MFNNDIPKISPGLQVYKKYLISNAIVRLILVKCQTAEGAVGVEAPLPRRYRRPPRGEMGLARW